jgi:hypothetical protein
MDGAASFQINGGSRGAMNKIVRYVSPYDRPIDEPWRCPMGPLGGPLDPIGGPKPQPWAWMDGSKASSDGILIQEWKQLHHDRQQFNQKQSSRSNDGWQAESSFHLKL